MKPPQIDPKNQPINPSGILVALELMELGIELTRQRLIRENPGANTREIEAMLNNWIMTPKNKI